MILRGIVCIIFLYFLFYMTGFLFSQITRQKPQEGKIVYGSVLTIAAFEIICFPFLIVKNYFNILYYIFLVIFVITVGMAIYLFIRKKGLRNIFGINFRGLSGGAFSLLFFLTLILQIFVVCYMHFDCYDDGYYIAISNMALEQNIVELNDKVVYAGNYMLESFNSRPGINSWELLIAFFAKLFRVHPAVLSHTFLPVLLLPLYYMAADQVMRKITYTVRDRFLCLFLYSLLVMFYGTGYLVPSYAVVGTWGGKALLFHLILPLLLSECIDIVEEKQTFATWIKIGVIAVAGVGATATGIYTVLIYLFTIAVPYILFLGYKRRLNTIIFLLKSAICSLWIFILIGIYAVEEMIRSGRNETIAGQGFNIESIYTKAFVQERIYTVLFITALVLIIFLEKSVRKKLLFIGQTAVLFLLVLNPLTAEFIAKYITGISVYWRMFLLLPVSYLIPLGGKYAMGFIASGKRRVSDRIIGGAGVILAAWLALSGQGLFSVFLPHQNIYMIPDEILHVCESFDFSSKEMITVLAGEPMNRFFRQYSSYFDVIIGRSSEVSRCKKEEEYKMVCHDIYEEGKIDEITNEYLKELEVEYIVSGKPLVNTEWVLCKKSGNYFIYEAKGHKKHYIIG